MAKDIYFKDRRNGDTYSQQNSSWNSEEYKERLAPPAPVYRPVPAPGVPVQGIPVNRPAKPKKKKKKIRPGRIILCILLAIFLAASGVIYVGARALLKNYESSELKENAYISTSILTSDPSVFNILLMGVDNADLHSDSRSDSMILLSIDTQNRQLKLTSFMRDMFVEVPGYGKTKLTHACQYGGAQLTVDTIEMDFGIEIDAYAKIGYEFLRDVVEGIGGITVAEIDETESAALKREGAYIAPGKDIHLNGFQALQYCRIRKGQSDFQRTERQREVITLVVEKAMHTNPLKLIKILSGAMDKIDCSIPKSDLIKTAFKILPCLFNDIQQLRIPADGEWWDETVSGMAVLQIDLDANKRILSEFIYGE